MKNSFIGNQIIDLQNEYCIILKNALNRIDTDDFFMTIDEINLFWYSNRDIVQLVLDYIAYDCECYTFTGASYLDIADNEHFPFSTLGDMHVVDDPLHIFLTAPYDIKNEEYKRKLMEQIKYTIEDNINIIEEYSNTILILPVTFLSDINSDLISKASNQAFFNMFKDDSMNYERYFNEFQTIKDVEQALDENIIKNIIFTEDDNVDDGLEKRYKDFSSLGNPFGNKLSEAKVFYAMINGYFAQAINILFKCSQYNMIPYLRYDVVFKYGIMLGSNFVDNEQIQELLFKTACAHILYKLFDKNKIEDVEYDKYLACIQEVKFSDKISKMFNQDKLVMSKFSLQEIIEFMKSELRLVYSCICKLD